MKDLIRNGIIIAVVTTIAGIGIGLESSTAVIIGIGTPIALFWYLNQVKMIWGSMMMFKTLQGPLRNIMEGNPPIGNIRKALIKELKKKDEEEEDNPAYGDMYQ
jgi:hypothetical protein